MATIYLSSTYEDLRDFRSAVVHALRQSEYRVIAMEDYVATDQRPVDKCLDDVEKADIYVGIFAFRYGYIPPAEHNNPNGLSITELELRHAQRLKKPYLTFLADQKASGFPPTLMDAFTGDGEDGKYIKRLRDELGRERTASFFSAPYHLASLVQAAVASHMATHNTPSSSGALQSPASASVIWDVKKNGSPYPGLMHFTSKYAKVFFGRDMEVRLILDRLREPEGRFLLITGASGSGKSSLVDAGVLPRIEQDGIAGDKKYTCVRMVPSRVSHPFDALVRPLHVYAEHAGLNAYELAEQLVTEPETLSQRIQDIVAKGLDTEGLVVFLDQMEELFTVRDQAQSQAFLSAMYQATQDASLHVIATIRSDFLHHCHEQADLLRILNGRGHIGLGPFDAGSIREMIRKPAQCAGLSVSEDLVRRLTREAGLEPGNLPLLAFALQQLFDKRKGMELTEQAYKDMGGVVGAIGQQADQVMAGLGKEALGAFDSVFAELVHLERERPPTRTRASLAVFELDTAANRLIEALAGPKCRILVKGGEETDATVEVAHEKLFTAWPKLEQWIDGSGEALRLIEHAEEEARRWRDRGDNPQELWLESRAKEVLAALQRFGKNPSPVLERFLKPQHLLIEQLNQATIPHERRALIGRILNQFGDTRPGVDLRDGLPDIVWIDIPSGHVKLEDIDHVFEVKPFRMAKYPVTNAQFDAFIKADGYRNEEWWNGMERSEEAFVVSRQEANSPRRMVSWFEAVAFCRWLSQRTGSKIRLPTEWEWQQAASGDDPTREYPWPGEWDASRCNSIESGETGQNWPTAVGMYPHGTTNKGVMDMAGNVWEWCLNTHEHPEAPESLRIDESNTARVRRGGSLFSFPVSLRVSSRDGGGAGTRSSDVGFRLAQDIP